MNNGISRFRNIFCNEIENGNIKTFELYKGIELSYYTLTTDKLCVHHEALNNILEINYCHSGQIGWEMKNGNRVYLGQHDFSLNTLKSCADSIMYFPTKYYKGLTISIDLNALTDTTPEILSGTGITGEFLYNKFCNDAPITFLAGNEETEKIFSSFYNHSINLMPSYRKIKVIELLLYLSELKMDKKDCLTEYQAEQITVIREIHQQLVNHMDKRLTIETLSKQYLMNPTSLKALFKDVYGTSIAAHIKEHRMQEAAKLLYETDLSIAEIAKQVGYDSQSKFSVAFKSYFQILPKEYRKKHRN